MIIKKEGKTKIWQSNCQMFKGVVRQWKESKPGGGGTAAPRVSQSPYVISQPAKAERFCCRQELYPK